MFILVPGGVVEAFHFVHLSENGEFHEFNGVGPYWRATREPHYPVFLHAVSGVRAPHSREVRSSPGHCGGGTKGGPHQVHDPRATVCRPGELESGGGKVAYGWLR